MVTLQMQKFDLSHYLCPAKKDMSFNGNTTLRDAMEIMASVSSESQKRMLYLLKLEKARSLARKLDKIKPKVKKTDRQITEIVHRIRSEYNGK